MGVYLHDYIKLKNPMLLDLKKKTNLQMMITALENLERVHHCWMA